MFSTTSSIVDGSSSLLLSLYRPSVLNLEMASATTFCLPWISLNLMSNCCRSRAPYWVLDRTCQLWRIELVVCDHSTECTYYLLSKKQIFEWTCKQHNIPFGLCSTAVGSYQMSLKSMQLGWGWPPHLDSVLSSLCEGYPNNCVLTHLWIT